MLAAGRHADEDASRQRTRASDLLTPPVVSGKKSNQTTKWGEGGVTRADRNRGRWERDR